MAILRRRIKRRSKAQKPSGAHRRKRKIKDKVRKGLISH